MARGLPRPYPRGVCKGEDRDALLKCLRKLGLRRQYHKDTARVWTALRSQVQVRAVYHGFSLLLSLLDPYDIRSDNTAAK